MLAKLVLERASSPSKLIRGRRGAVSFEDAAKQVLDHWRAVGARKRTYDKNKGTLEIHLKQAFQGLLSSEIDAAAVDRYVAQRRGEGAASRTIKRELAVLGRTLSYQVEIGALERLPYRRMPRVKLSRVRPVRVFSDEEIGALLEAAESIEWEAFILLGFGCGLRPGESLNLPWDHVDLQGRSVRIDDVPDAKWQPKNAASHRTVPLHADALAVLTTLAQRDRAHLRSADGKPRYVIKNRDGRPFTGITRPWVRMCGKAGLVGERYASPHSLRHTWSTRAFAAARPDEIPELCRIGGWSSPEIPFRVYVHSRPDAGRAVVDRLPRVAQNRHRKTAKNGE